MKKLLVANRSEIAIRVMRAATELGLQTVAVYTHEDRFALHRFKADESYRIGPSGGGEPVKGYLNINGIIRTAIEHDADAIHPGYGFLSENSALARACAKAGITFIGPTPRLLDIFGDKTAARKHAAKVGVPVLPGTPRGLKDLPAVRAAASRIGYPVMLKASHGGGGRGMRIVRSARELAAKLAEAQREAGAAFGRSEVFVEKYISHARHIEVQILADAHGNLVHLHERDCSVQRRHQKVVEVAPAANLHPELRRRICAAAVRIARGVRYVNAGTVEFLLDAQSGEFYFIEVNPRVQVEHTVTEVVTGIDIVKTQILIAQGFALHEPPINIPPQDRIDTRGVAIQCRITTEDPANHFIPDYGRLSTYRSAAGFGIRLDGGSAFGGAVITPYFDSLLVKVTASGSDLREAIRRMDRALREFRVRGVKTNIPFLENLIHHPRFASGDATTTFIDSTPELFRFRPRRDRATKILSYLGDVVVNGRADVKGKVDGARAFAEAPLPAFDARTAPPAGTREMLRELGAKEFARWVRRQMRLLITDTTMRDAHQSLLATRVRTFDLLRIAPAVARLAPQLFSLEMWGGATFDTSMRFLQEDPWERLGELRTRVPNILFQMLLRGSNAVGYTSYPDNVIREFVRRAAQRGIDVFRIFDSLNSIDNLVVAMDAVNDTGALCEAAICYTGDILDPRRSKYGLKYYVKMARELVRRGTHILGIKDMAGLCRPYAAHALVKALRDVVDVPIHFHTHDTAGVNAGSILRAADAGVDIADAAIATMSGFTSQPNLNAIVAALAHTRRDTGLEMKSLNRIADYWHAVRQQYYPFEEQISSPSADVYEHEMPGGQYTNLRQQAASMGLGDRWRDVAEMFATVNRMFGDIVKVTPSSKVVGDMALFMVTNNLTPDDVLDPKRRLGFPRSVVEMMQGAIGTPPGGWPQHLQRIILRSAKAKRIRGRPGAKLRSANFARVRTELTHKLGRAASADDVLSYILYPQVFLDFARHVQNYSHTDVIPTPAFFFGLKKDEEVAVEIEPGKTLLIKLLTMSDPHEDGTRTVFFELNGQPREVKITDRSLEVSHQRHPKADEDNPRHVGAPMPGKVSTVAVEKGAAVKSGAPLLSIEAMKMEAAVYSPRDARVAEVLVKPGSVISARDLLVVLE